MKQLGLSTWIRRAALSGIGAAIVGSGMAPALSQAEVVPDRPPATLRKPSPATDLDAALDQTAVVVEGEVSDIRYEYSEEEGPWTSVTLSGVEAHFGWAPPVLEIRQFGGELPDGRMMVAAELPVFLEGKRYLVLLRNTQWNVSPVVGDLALRIEEVDGTEVLVNSDGQAVTEVAAAGVALAGELFEAPGLDGTPPRKIKNALKELGRKPLDRKSFVAALDARQKSTGRRVGGTFYERPAGEFKWRGQQVGRSPGSQPSRDTSDPDAAPEVDASGRRG